MHRLRAFFWTLLLLACGQLAAAQTLPETGSITTATSGPGNCVSIRAQNNSAVGFILTGTWSGTLQPSIYIFPARPVNKKVQQVDTGTIFTTLTSNGTPNAYLVNVGGFALFQLCASSWSSGTAVVDMFSTPAPNNATIAANGTIGTVTSVSGTTSQIDSTGGATPVISLDPAVILPGTLTAPSGGSIGVSGTGTNTATSIVESAGCTSNGAGSECYDTTAKNTHISSNGADALAVTEAGAITSQKLIKSNSNTLSSQAGSSISDAGVYVMTPEPVYAGNGTTLTSATTITSTTFITTGLAMPTSVVSTTQHGECHITWEQSTAVGTVEFGIGNNNNSTALYVQTPTIWNGTAISKGTAYQTITGTTTTAITSTITPAAIGTGYTLDFYFTLVTGSGSTVITTIYGLTSSSSDALVIEPGSTCYWTP
jgi:hypothetical protein